MVCKNCGSQVSKNHKNCPRCGQRITNPWILPAVILGIVLIIGLIVAALFIGISLGKGEADTANNTATENNVRDSDIGKQDESEADDGQGASEDEADKETNEAIKNDSSPLRLERIEIYSEDERLIREFDNTDILELYFDVIEYGAYAADYHERNHDDIDYTEYKIKYIAGDASDTYRFLMSPKDKGEHCYFITDDGKAYSINDDHAFRLLSRSEFSTAYANSEPPKLIFRYKDQDGKDMSQSVTANISDRQWIYRLVNSEYVYAQTNTNSSAYNIGKIHYPASGTDLEISFDDYVVEPSKINVTIKEKDEIIGETADLYDLDLEISRLNRDTPLNLNDLVLEISQLNRDTTLNISISAEWQETKDCEYFGKCDYRFDIIYDKQSTFEFVDFDYGSKNKGKIRKGTFAVLKIKDADPSESITVESDIMERTMQPFVYNDEVYVYIPIKPDATIGINKVTVNEFAGRTELNFNVVDEDFGNPIAPIGVSPALDELKNTSYDEYLEFLEKHRNTFSEKMYWVNKEKWLQYPLAAGKNAVIKCNFGQQLGIVGNEHISQGVYFKATPGESVFATCDGKVLFAGETAYTGNAVIIDHGLGIISYYFNLGSVGYKVGDEVKRGDAIGTAGATGYTPFECAVYYANTVGGCFVEPIDQIKFGITI